MTIDQIETWVMGASTKLMESRLNIRKHFFHRESSSSLE